MWYADPAGRTEIEEFRAAGHVIRRGYNDIRLGIAAVTARIRPGRLKVNRLRCPNLAAEAKLYRYPSQFERTAAGRTTISENPVDEHNHALAALRYLVSRLDSRFITKLRGTAKSDGPIEVDAVAASDQLLEAARSIHRARPAFDVNDPDLWTTIN